MRRSVAAVLVVSASVLLPAAPVWAHASLEQSEPAANSVLVDGPTEVRLDFDEDVEPALSSIHLYGSDGVELGLGDTVAGTDRSVVTASVPSLDDGVYAVVWQVTSGDGHVVDGAFSFQVGVAAVGDGDALVQQVASGGGDGASNRWLAVARFVSLVGVMLCIGVVGWGATGLGALVAARRMARLRRASVALLLLGSAATLLLFASQSGGALGDVVGTTTGSMLLVRTVLALPVASLVTTSGSCRSISWRCSATVVALALAVSCSASGHPNQLDPAALWVAIDALHVLAIAAWLGGLTLLVLADRTALEAPEAVRSVRRYSAVALGAVLVAVVTGVAQGLRLAGGVDDVAATTWGRLLLVKVTVIVGVIAVAGVSRWLLHHEGPGSLRRTVVLEAIASVVVLALAAGMVGEAPRSGARATAFDEQLVADGVIASVAISPGRVGTNEVHVLVTPAGGSLTAVDSATARVSLPSLPDVPVTLASEGPNHFSGSVTFPRAGEWTLELVLTAGSSTTLLSATVTVP